MALQVNLKTLRSTDSQRVQRLYNDAMQALELKSCTAYDWHRKELDAREMQLHRIILADDHAEDVAVVKGRILELRRIRDEMVEGRVQALNKLRAALQKHTIESQLDNPEGDN